MKKKIIAAMLATAMFASIPLSASAFMGSRQVVVDGFALGGSAIDKSNTTFVPFRQLFTQLGMTIKYDTKTKKVTGSKGNKTATFTVGSKTAYINGKKKTLTAAPFVSNGSVYVPLRAVAEATGSLAKHVTSVDVVLVNSPSFKGSTYSSPNGTITITKDGRLSKSNNLALMDFLNFMPEEEIMLNKDVSKGKTNNVEKMTPDMTFNVVVDEKKLKEKEEEEKAREERIQKIIEESEERDRKKKAEQQEFLDWVAAQDAVRAEQKRLEEEEREKRAQEIRDFLDSTRN